VTAVEIGKERVEEDELRVGRLPQQEVGDPLLPRRPDEQVDVRYPGLIQVAAATSAAIAAAASAISARPP
jgi:hypothetical protein